MSGQGLLVERDGAVLRLTLHRPEVHNALDGSLIEALTIALKAVPAGGPVRLVQLGGAGASFCAGADLAWMRTVAAYTYDENREDARRLAALFAALNGCLAPTMAVVQGTALGGGAGLLACCDMVIAAEDARFGFTESRLGILPAVVSPFVVAKIGAGHARALFASGERFDAARALRIGLVHQMVPPGELQDAAQRQVRELLRAAPGAATAARTLVEMVTGRTAEEVRDYTVETIAQLRAGEEGREGIAAFLEKRPPRWVQDDTP
jgi:methylglutaconyl-CoA hydratase